MNVDILFLLVGAAVIGLAAVIVILLRQATERRDSTRETPFAASTEGMKRCRHCGRGNLSTDATCSYCRAPLEG